MSKRIDEIEKTILKMLDLINENTESIFLQEKNISLIIKFLEKRKGTND